INFRPNEVRDANGSELFLLVTRNKYVRDAPHRWPAPPFLIGRRLARVADFEARTGTLNKGFCRAVKRDRIIYSNVSRLNRPFEAERLYSQYRSFFVDERLYALPQNNGLLLHDAGLMVDRLESPCENTRLPNQHTSLNDSDNDQNDVSQITIRSTSRTLTSSLRRSYMPVVLAFECPAMRCATSIRPPFFK